MKSFKLFFCSNIYSSALAWGAEFCFCGQLFKNKICLQGLSYTVQHSGSLGIYWVISEFCYKGTILQRNSWKMTI